MESTADGRRTTEQVLMLQKFVKQVNEWPAMLYLNFIDFEKDFDSTKRESQWTIMKKDRIPEKIARMVKIIYEDFQCAGEDQGEIYEWFGIKTGVKQGCNMSGFLFLIVVDWLMRRPVGYGKNGIWWSFNNISRKTKSRLYKKLVVPVLLYGCETWKMNKGDKKMSVLKSY